MHLYSHCMRARLHGLAKLSSAGSDKAHHTDSVRAYGSRLLGGLV